MVDSCSVHYFSLVPIHLAHQSRRQLKQRRLTAPPVGGLRDSSLPGRGRGLSLLTFVGLGVGALEHALVAVRDWLVDALTTLTARTERVHDVAEVGSVGDLR